MKRIIPCALLLAYSATINFAADSKGTILFNKDNGYKPIPRFSNGWTIFFDRDQATISCYDLGGSLRFKESLALPDTSRIFIREVTANKAGSAAVSATVTSRNSQVASVILLLSPAGKIDRVIQTGNFAAGPLMFDSTGQLWAAGKVHDGTFREVPAFDTIRQYDERGTLLRSFLPTETFRRMPAPATESLFAANQDRVGVYFKEANEYIEFDLSGQIAGRWTIAAPDEKPVTAAALTSTGQLYIGGFNSKRRNMFAYRLDKSSARFLPVALPDDSGSPSRMLTLMGAEGGDLIILTQPPGITRLTPE